MDRLKYIRTDRNGTKIYEDWTCPRCGGQGWAGQWKYTGVTCFRCGGSGLRNRPTIVKEYTDEYWAKLEAKRKAREEQYIAEHADEIAAAEAEKKRREAEQIARENKRNWMSIGCDENGIGYIYAGNTYPVKDDIKSSGGKWVSQTWIAPVQIKAKGVYSFRMDAKEFINEYGVFFDQDAREVAFLIGQRKMNYEEAKEQVKAWNEEGL